MSGQSAGMTGRGVTPGWALLACLLMVMGSPCRALAGDGAAVFAYDQFGNDEAPAESIRIEQFEAHLAELTADGYAVLPLPQVVDALDRGTALPDPTVALTIDGATRSMLDIAVPRLRRAGLPFTLFVAPQPIDQGSPRYASWNDLRALRGGKVTFGLLIPPGADPNSVAWARRRLGKELGVNPTLVAYGGGEYDLAMRRAVAIQGFGAAFTQASGVVHPRADRLALPRFLMNEAFGGIDRFRLAAHALPLPVTDVTPADPVLGPNPPTLGFTVPPDLPNLDQLACFASGQGRAKVELLGDGRVEVRLAEPFLQGHGRVNCTVPAEAGRWRWFGIQFFSPDHPPE